MMNQRFKKIRIWIGAITFLSIISFLGLLISTVFLEIKADNQKAIALVHQGHLEVRRKIQSSNNDLFPSEAATKLAQLGYWIDFEPRENQQYELGVELISFHFFYDPYFCINQNGEYGIFDHFNCEL
tara:strand:- start:190 stop:570 length:381 start_codon:yes stop_codon:yes gene_type:complete